MSDWMRLCQDCWQARNPEQYCPELTSYGECADCGYDSLTVGVRRSQVEDLSVSPFVKLAAAALLPVKDYTEEFTK